MNAAKLETWSEDGRDAVMVHETVRSGDACPHCGGALVAETMTERWQRWAEESDQAVGAYRCRKCRGLVIAVVPQEARR